MQHGFQVIFLTSLSCLCGAMAAELKLGHEMRSVLIISQVKK